ncbi:MAG: phosphoglycerate kinase [Candidatus Omnitrophota bacterium]
MKNKQNIKIITLIIIQVFLFTNLATAAEMLSPYLNINSQVIQHAFFLKPEPVKGFSDISYSLRKLGYRSYQELTPEKLRTKVTYFRGGGDVPFDKKSTEFNPKRIKDPVRLKVVLPVIRHILGNQGKILWQPGWMGRPDGVDIKLSTASLFLYTRDLLLKEGIIHDPDEMILAPTNLDTNEVKSVYANIDEVSVLVQKELREKNKVQIIFLENPRMDPEYDKADPGIGEALAKIVDLAVYDDFHQQHRPPTDITGLPNFVPAYVGDHMAEEIIKGEEVLKILAEPDRGKFILYIGGKKIENKPGKISKVVVARDLILRNLMRNKNEDEIRIGGGVSYGFMIAKSFLNELKLFFDSQGKVQDSQGLEKFMQQNINLKVIKDLIGDSYIIDENLKKEITLETEKGLKEAHSRIANFASLLVAAEAAGINVEIPKDYTICNKITGEIKFNQTRIPRGWYGIDIGTETQQKYNNQQGARIVIIAGPMGIADDPKIPEGAVGTNVA